MLQVSFNKYCCIFTNNTMRKKYQSIIIQPKLIKQKKTDNSKKKHPRNHELVPY